MAGPGNLTTLIDSAGNFVAAAPNVVDVILSLDTGIYADGEVLADTQVVAGAVLVSGGSVLLQSVTVLDEDDQGVAFDLIFLDANVSLGTENAAPSISDVNARSIIGPPVRIATGDYIDIGGARIGGITGIAMPLKAAAASTSLYVAAITRGGTPTYTAAGLKLKLGFI